MSLWQTKTRGSCVTSAEASCLNRLSSNCIHLKNERDDNGLAHVGTARRPFQQARLGRSREPPIEVGDGGPPVLEVAALVPEGAQLRVAEDASKSTPSGQDKCPAKVRPISSEPLNLFRKLGSRSSAEGRK